MNKIVSTKRTSAIYLIIVLGSGTISFMYPSFIIWAQAESDYNDESDKENNKLNRMEDNDEESDNDELKNDDNNSYEDNKDEIKEASYGSDGNNNYYKTKDSNSVFVKKLKCNNINVNLNWVDADLGLPNSDDSIAEAQTLDEGTDFFVSNSEKRQSDSNTDSGILCMNNNNRQGETPTPPQELANLNVIKNVECESNGGSPNNAAVCDFVEANISSEDFEMSVTGNNPNPAFQIGGIVTDTLGNGKGLPIIGVILEP